MTTQTLKRTRAKFVSKQTVEQVGTVLQDLPEKTPDNHSLRQAVEQLRETIETALAKGYSYEDLIQILAGKGIDIQPSTLKRYILTSPTRSTTKRSSSDKTKTRQTRKKLEPTATIEDALVTAQEEAPAAATTRKKRTKAEAEGSTTAPASAKRGRVMQRRKSLHPPLPLKLPKHKQQQLSRADRAGSLQPLLPLPRPNLARLLPEDEKRRRLKGKNTDNNGCTSNPDGKVLKWFTYSNTCSTVCSTPRSLSLKNVVFSTELRGDQFLELLTC